MAPSPPIPASNQRNSNQAIARALCARNGKILVMTTKLSAKLKFIYAELFKLYGEVACPLNHETTFQLLVATMLSAQCTDLRVNMVTAELFKHYPDAKAFAAAEPEEIETHIRSLGLFHTKAKNLVNAARQIQNEFNGKVPENMADLTSLPGIGRKTANVILGNAFGIPGLPVDTHVLRLSGRLGIDDSKNPEKVEKLITTAIAPKYWTNLSHLLIQHGRKVCTARKPACNQCPLQEICTYYHEKGKNV